MNTEPLISIIIPSFNRAPLLPRAIQSVLLQKFINWELIIIDDGSTDNTKEAVIPFLKDSRIKYILKSNSGAAHSRNIGVDHSSGEYITFLDSDDEAYSDWLLLFSQSLDIKHKKAKLICCGVEYFNEEENKLIESGPHSNLLFYPGVRSKFLGGAFLVSKEIFIRIGGYDSELASGQHTDLGLRIMPEINKEEEIITIEKSLVKVYIHGGEKVRSSPSARYKGAKRMLFKYSKKFNDDPALKSKYQSIVAYNASKLGLKREALRYSIAAMTNYPSLKKFLGIFKYGF